MKINKKHNPSVVPKKQDFNIFYSAATSDGQRPSNQDNAYIDGYTLFGFPEHKAAAFAEISKKDSKIFPVSANRKANNFGLAFAGILHSFTDIANKRSSPVPIRRIVGVFDGVGGTERGSDASTIAALCARELDNADYELTANKSAEHLTTAESETSLTDYFLRTNQFINNYSNYVNCASMSTTALLCEIRGNRITIANAGDCRAYLIKKNRICILSNEHFDGAAKMRHRLFAKYRRNSGKSNIITRFLGSDESFRCEPTISREVVIEPGDTIVLCSDGVYSMFSDHQIKKLVKKSDMYVSAMRLVERAVSLGSRDNATAIVLRAE